MTTDADTCVRVFYCVSSFFFGVCVCVCELASVGVSFLFFFVSFAPPRVGGARVETPRVGWSESATRVCSRV